MHDYIYKDTLRINRVTRHMRDIAGERNGDIEALAPHHQEIYYYKHRRPQTYVHWLFYCHRCGEEFISRHTLIDEPDSGSCGCYKRDVGCKKGAAATAKKLKGKPATRKGVKYPGVTIIAKEHGMHASTLIRRLDRGMSMEEAIHG